MKGKVTIYTLAEELGMTPSMVSRALSGGRVDEGKRRLVLDLASKYNYMPNKFASRLSMKPVKIGVLICGRYISGNELMKKGIEMAHRELCDYKIELDIVVKDDLELMFEEVCSALDSFYGYDGVIVAGLSSEAYTRKLNSFAEKTPNLVMLQSINNDVNFLFASKHDEKAASGIACDFLCSCLKNAKTRNVVLFTGSLDSEMHCNAKAAFLSSCAEKGIDVVDVFDMKDNENVLSKQIPLAFGKSGDRIDACYITSGKSLPLCNYIMKNQPYTRLVTFDVYEGLNTYINNGTVDATIYQNLERQGYIAFRGLIEYIIEHKKPDRVIYTNVQLVTKTGLDLI